MKRDRSAAATAVIMAGGRRAYAAAAADIDRPFLFAARQKDTGAILFLGSDRPDS